MRRLILSFMAGLALLACSPSPPAFGQSYGGFNQPKAPKPDAPTGADKMTIHSDEGLLGNDEKQLEQDRMQEADYKSQMDEELANARSSLPEVEEEVAELKGHYSAPTLQKMLSNPASRYSVLLTWLRNEKNLEGQEKSGLKDYNQNIAVLTDEANSDRYNVVQDQQLARDHYQQYQKKLYSESEKFAQWGYRNSEHLARIESGGGGYGGYGGYGYLGGGWGGWGGLSAGW